MAQRFVVQKYMELANGQRTHVVVRTFASKEDADRFCRREIARHKPCLESILMVVENGKAVPLMELVEYMRVTCGISDTGYECFAVEDGESLIVAPDNTR